MLSAQINKLTFSPGSLLKIDASVAKRGLNLAPGRDSYSVLLMTTSLRTVSVGEYAS